jgi:hypothetical protein
LKARKGARGLIAEEMKSQPVVAIKKAALKAQECLEMTSGK